MGCVVFMCVPPTAPVSRYICAGRPLCRKNDTERTALRASLGARFARLGVSVRIYECWVVNRVRTLLFASFLREERSVVDEMSCVVASQLLTVIFSGVTMRPESPTATYSFAEPHAPHPNQKIKDLIS